MRYLAVPILFALGACATATEIRGPEGQQGYLIECPGMAQSMGDCVSRANELCPAGYQILDRQQGGQGIVGTSTFIASPVERSLIVQCVP